MAHLKILLGAGHETEHWNERALNGEPGTGYEDGDGLGEFECENCRYFEPEEQSCWQPDMVAKSVRPRNDEGDVLVDPESCCDYIKRLGIVEPHEREEQEE